MSRRQPGKGGQEGPFRQGDSLGKVRRQSVDTEGALPQCSFVSTSESLEGWVCPAPCDPHIHCAPHP